MDVTFSLNMAEQRLMQRGTWKDCIQNYDATVVGGLVAFPLEVQTVLAVDVNGHPIPIRSEFFEYLDNGPGMFASHQMLVDQGDQTFVDGRRRVYKLVPNITPTEVITAICKLRWLEKNLLTR